MRTIVRRATINIKIDVIIYVVRTNFFVKEVFL